MKIESLPAEIQDTVNQRPGMKQYLHNLQVGRPFTPRSWLYEGESADAILARWMSILDTLKHGDAREERVYQFDTSQLKKWGPQGGIAPIKELMDLVTEGFKSAGTPKPAPYKTEMWQKAKEIAIRILFKDRHIYKSLRPMALGSVIDNMAARDTLESNSGYPSFTTRKNNFVKKRAIKDALSGKWLSYPAIVLFRNYNGKTRPVWMYPMSTNIVEGSFAIPLKMAVTDSSSFFAPWRGYDAVRNAMTEAYEAGDYLSASDFTHTDAHFVKWQVLEVYDVVKFGFQEKFWPALKESLLRVVEIPLIIGETEWITGAHGVSSGSIWTNDIETYLDFIAEIYLVLRTIVASTFNGIGDDVCHRLKQYNPDFADQVADVYQSMGFDVNSEKVTNNRDDVKYLQRLVMRGYYSTEHSGLRGIYSTIRALNSSVQPEKFHKPKLWSKDMFAARQFMILENVLDHPLFKEFVRFVCDGHPYLVEFAKKTAKELDEIQVRTKLLPGLNPTYNQEKRDSKLSQFASIREARLLS